jgi:hypothetical protein
MSASTIAQISERLASGRQALEELIDIASELERTRAGLENSAYLNVASAYLPPALRRIWKTLDNTIQSLSREELLAKLTTLERQLATRLEGALTIVDSVCNAAQSGKKINIAGFRGTLADVSRLAGTALAIRIMARNKNYALTPAELPVAAEFLREKVSQIRAVEQVHKKRAVAIIDDMTDAAGSALQSKEIDSAQRAQLVALSKDLQINKQYLSGDGNFEALPVVMAALQIPAKLLPENLRSQAHKLSQARGKSPSAKPRSSWLIWRRQLRIWLDTPFGVSWREAGRRARSDS